MKNETVINKTFLRFATKSELYFADASFLVSEYFMDVFYPMLECYNSLKNRKKIKIFILPFCIMNLRELSLCDDAALSQRAAYALNTICRDIRKNRNFIEYTSGASDMSFNATLLSAALVERINSSISILTQNKKLTSDLYSFNELTSCRGEPISVYSFNEYGKLHMPYAHPGIEGYDKAGTAACLIARGNKEVLM